MKKIQFLFVFISLSLFISCDKSVQKVSSIDLMKENLKETLNEKYPDLKFTYSATHQNDKDVVLMKNASVDNQVNLTQKDANVLLGYYSEALKGQNAIMYKTELVKKGKQLSVITSDLKGNIIRSNDFPIQDNPGTNSPNGFDTLDECIDSFFCTFEGVQCEANKTCKTINYGTTCCLSDGTCYSIHFSFPPTNPWCKFQIEMLDIPLVVTRF